MEMRTKRSESIECFILEISFDELYKAVRLNLQPTKLEQTSDNVINLWYHCSSPSEYKEVEDYLNTYDTWKFKFDIRTAQTFEFSPVYIRCIII